MEDIFKHQSTPIVDIRIQEEGEVGFDKVLGIPDNETIIFGPVEKAFILKGAMASGKSSVTLYCEVKPGVHVALETSYTMLKMITNVAENTIGEW